MFLISLSLSLAGVYLLTNVLLVLWRNYNAHQFFKIKTPNLPTIPKPSIFHGHLIQVTRQKNLNYLEEMHSRYGPTFGYYVCEQPWVSTKDLDLIKHIELDQPDKHLDRAHFGLPIEEFSHSILEVNGERWRRIRRIVASTLTNHKVRSDEITLDIQSVVDQLVGGLELQLQKGETHSGKRVAVVDIGNMFLRYVMAVIFLVTYKQEQQIDFLVDQDDWTEKMDRISRQVSSPITHVGMMFPFARPFIGALIRLHPVGRMSNKIIGFIHQATNINQLARVEHGKSQHSLDINSKERKPFNELQQSGQFKRRLVDTIIDAFIDKQIDRDSFMSTLWFLVLAGSMTTADTLTCLVWNLVQHPEIQEKLREEVATKGADCEFLHWCIKETIRWHPAVPYGAGRVLGEDVKINGTHLAKGTFVMPSTYSIHHDESIWPEADKFLPERWRNGADFHSAAFMGFGLGPRNCVGAKLAFHEIRLTTVALLSRYRFVKCSETLVKYEFSSPAAIFAHLDKPLKIKLVAL